MGSECDSEYLNQQVGNYRLLRVLGRGGFANVYLGEHIYLKTQAAIKILRTPVAEAGIESVLNEARTIARLDHPNIIRVLECDIKDDHLFLVMTYASRGTIRHRYPSGTRLSPLRVLSYVQQLASALQYAHDQKLIHRDVKPENMLIGTNDNILLSDFGLVMIVDTSHSHPTGHMAGTMAYMAPEQLQGKPRFASDQYALGIVAYEWLSGTRPFTGSFVEIASQQVLSSPPSLCERVPALPPAVEQVVFKALAKNASDRFEDVGAFADALAQVLDVSLPRLSSATSLLPSTYSTSEMQCSTTARRVPRSAVPAIASPNATLPFGEDQPIAVASIPSPVSQQSAPMAISSTQDHAHLAQSSLAERIPSSQAHHLPLPETEATRPLSEPTSLSQSPVLHTSTAQNSLTVARKSRRRKMIRLVAFIFALNILISAAIAFIPLYLSYSQNSRRRYSYPHSQLVSPTVLPGKSTVPAPAPLATIPVDRPDDTEPHSSPTAVPHTPLPTTPTEVGEHTPVATVPQHVPTVAVTPTVVPTAAPPADPSPTPVPTPTPQPSPLPTPTPTPPEVTEIPTTATPPANPTSQSVNAQRQRNQPRR